MTILALAGGVGGAKLAHGLQALRADQLQVVVNTGDDFEHLGFSISPDLDTVMYTLAGLENRETGWGVRGETWSFMDALAAVGGETWFNLGDRDLATHVERTRRLRNGETLAAVTADLSRRLEVAARILPMSDGRVSTQIHTPRGRLSFQEYFVACKCEPVANGFTFDGIEAALPGEGFIEALSSPSLEALVICPSNPFVSIGPILALPGIRARLAELGVPSVAVSPIVGGDAIKGPAAKMMRELGHEVSPLSIALMYKDVLDGIIIDQTDAQWMKAIEDQGIAVTVTDTIMRTADERRWLAEETLVFVESLKAGSGDE